MRVVKQLRWIPHESQAQPQESRNSRRTKSKSQAHVHGLTLFTSGAPSALVLKGTYILGKPLNQSNISIIPAYSSSWSIDSRSVWHSAIERQSCTRSNCQQDPKDHDGRLGCCWAQLRHPYIQDLPCPALTATRIA